MGTPRGIIYGMQAFLCWSSGYPNARLIVLGSFMFAVLPYLLLSWLFNVADLAIKNAQSVRLFDAAFSAVIAGSIFSLGIHIAGMGMIVFGIRGITMGRNRNRPANPPAALSDSTTDSN
jgi:hypothetical protein